jgi:hypothetical protein
MQSKMIRLRHIRAATVSVSGDFILGPRIEIETLAVLRRKGAEGSVNYKDR